MSFDWLPSEWASYTLTDFLLFSPAIYRRLFALYHADIWPAQWLFAALGLVLLLLLRADPRQHARIVSGVIAGCWLWVAFAFLLRHYATINWAAEWFALAFAAQALLLGWTGIVRAAGSTANAATATGAALASDARNRSAIDRRDAFVTIGGAVVVYALAIHPVVGYLAGRLWTELEMFGATPDSTVLATLGVLLRADRARARLYVVPLLWCAVSGALLVAMGSPEALPVLGIGAMVTVLAPWRAWRRRIDRERPLDRVFPERNPSRR